MIVFRVTKIITFITLLIASGCLPDSFTKFKEDPPAQSTQESGGTTSTTVPGVGTPSCTASPAECTPPTGIVMEDIKISIGVNEDGDPVYFEVDPASGEETSINSSATFLPRIEGSIQGSGDDPSTADLMVWSINSTLPAGMSFNTQTGQISGVPTGYVSLSGVTISAIHTSSGEARSTTFNISAVHKLQEISYDQTYNQLIIVKLESDGNYQNFDNNTSDENVPNVKNTSDVINNNLIEPAIGAIEYIDYGPNGDGVDGELHIRVQTGSFKVGDRLSPNRTVFFEPSSDNPYGVIKEIIYAYDTGSTLTLTPTLSPVLDPIEMAAVKFDLSINPLSLSPFITIDEDNGTITMNPGVEVSDAELIVRARSSFVPGVEALTRPPLKIVRRTNAPAPKRINDIFMKQDASRNDKLIVTLLAPEPEVLARFNPEDQSNSGQDVFITSNEGNKAKVLLVEGDKLFLEVQNTLSTSVFKNEDELDVGNDFFIAEASINSGSQTNVTHAFSVDTVNSIKIEPIISPMLIENEGTCDDVDNGTVNEASCLAMKGTWNSGAGTCNDVPTIDQCATEDDIDGSTDFTSQRDTIRFTSFPDINNIGICVYEDANPTVGSIAQELPTGCRTTSNTEWYEITGECIDKNYMSEMNCEAIANRSWKGLHFGYCSNGDETLSKSDCTGGNTWIEDGIIRGKMYYPLSEETIKITATNARDEIFEFNYKLSINSQPRILSYNDMMILPVNDTLNFKKGDFVTGQPTSAVTYIDEDSGEVQEIPAANIDCRDPRISKLQGDFSAVQTELVKTEPFWFCPRGIVVDTIQDHTIADPAYKALVIKVLKGQFSKNMELDNFQYFGLGQATRVQQDPIPFSMIFDIDTAGGAGTASIFAGDIVQQTTAKGRIAYIKRTSGNIASLYVTYDAEASNGATFKTESGDPLTSINLEVANQLGGAPNIINNQVVLKQIYATAIEGIAAGDAGSDANFSKYDDISFLDTSVSPQETGSGIIMDKTLDPDGKNHYDIKIFGGSFKRGSTYLVEDINPTLVSNYANHDHISVGDTHFDQLVQLNAYYLYRDEAITIKSHLHDGGTNSDLIRYSVNPALPQGLKIDTKTGDIYGTPHGKTAMNTYVVTATTPFGTASYGLNIQVSDFFGIDFAPASTGSRPPNSFLVHKTGQSNGRTPCRINEEQITNGETNNRDIVDVQCFVEAGEEDLMRSRLEFFVKVPNNICSYFVEDPYAFWAFKPTQSSGETLIQHNNNNNDVNFTGNPWDAGNCTGASRKVFPSNAAALQAARAATPLGEILPNTVYFDNSGLSASQDVFDNLEVFSGSDPKFSVYNNDRFDWSNNPIQINSISDENINRYMCKGDYSGEDTNINCDAGEYTKVEYDWEYHSGWCLNPTTGEVDEGNPENCDIEMGSCTVVDITDKTECEAVGTWIDGIRIEPFCIAAKKEFSAGVSESIQECGGEPSQCMFTPTLQDSVLDQEAVAKGVVKVTNIIQDGTTNLDIVDPSNQPRYPDIQTLSEDFIQNPGNRSWIAGSTAFYANYFNLDSLSGANANLCAETSMCTGQNPAPADPEDHLFTERYCGVAGETWDDTVVTDENAYQVDFERVRAMARGGYCSRDKTITDKATCEATAGQVWVPVAPTSFGSDTVFNDITHAFHGARPFYTYSCLDGAGQTKARIRLVVREWNKLYRLTDFVDRFNPDLSTTDTNGVMDNEQPLLIPNPVTGASSQNDYPDWDDSIHPFDDSGNYSCEAPSIKSTINTRFPGFYLYR